MVNGKSISDSTTTTNEFNDYFINIGAKLAAEYDDSCSNYSCSNDNKPINYNQPINYNGINYQIDSLKFSPILVDNVISTLKALKTGLDQIPAKILKLSVDIVAPSLTFIFNLSLTAGIYVDEWKQARVTPIYKSGDKRLCENYRPISVLPIVSKAFEKEVFRQVYTGIPVCELSIVKISTWFSTKTFNCYSALI